MRALTFSTFGGPEVLEVKDLPSPNPPAGWVRIRVKAATVNPTDLGFRGGGQAAAASGLQPPYIPGMEFAGTVDAAGEGSPWKAGDKVMAIVVPRRPEGGAMAEEVIVPSRSVAPMPEGSSFEQAATLPMNGLTVRRALDLLALKPGDTLAVSGAAGAVGAYAVELGVADGLKVIAIASPADEPLMKKMGASAFVARGDDAIAKVREIAPGGVDGFIDAALLGVPALAAIKDGGGMAVVRGWQAGTERDITIHQVRVSDYVENQEALAKLGKQVEEGKITLRVQETFPPERAAEAHNKMAAGGIRGRLVITF